MKLVLVGEMWGPHEKQYQHPLVWWSGRELASMIAEADLAPPIRAPYPSELDMIAYWRALAAECDIAVTNVFNEHPDNENTELFFSREGDIVTDLPPLRIGSRVLYLRNEYKYHVDRLWDELALWQPNLIIAMGNFASWALIGQTSISEIRGTPKLSLRNNYKVIPTFNPAALRDWKLRPTIIADLCKAKNECEFPEIRRIKRWIVCEDPRTHTRVTLDEISAWFNQPAHAYSVDIESGYALFSRAELKAMTAEMRMILAELISMISFARDPFHSCVIPFMTRDADNLCYWNKADEIRAWTTVAQQLASPIPKTFQNGIYDISVLLNNNILVMNAIDDTMILQHTLYPELRKNLGYLGSIHTSEISWKQIRAAGEQLKREE